VGAAGRGHGSMCSEGLRWVGDNATVMPGVSQLCVATATAG
jgi:hypothetical protein